MYLRYFFTGDVMNKLKIGLVLEGGSMRGMFTCGVLDVLMENEIEFDGAIGVSAGAAFGCNYKSKQPGRAIRYNMKYCNDKRFAGIGNFIKTGNIFSKKFCYETIPNELDVFDRETFKNNPMEFYIVATDVEKGCEVYYKLENGDDEAALEYSQRFAQQLRMFPEILRFETMDMNSSSFGQWYQTLPQDCQQIIAIYLYLCDPKSM